MSFRRQGLFGAWTLRAATLFAVVAATLTALPSGAGAAGSVRSSGRATPMTLVSQSQWVTPGQPFDLTVKVGTPVPAGSLEVRLTLYDHLTARSTFESTASSGNPAGGVLDTAGPVGVPAGAPTAALSLPVRSSGSSPSSLALDLHCPTGSCSGVYPLVVTLERAGSGATVSRLLTYLTYDESDLTTAAAASGPGALRVAWVAPVNSPVTIGRTGLNPFTALQAPSPRTAAALQSLTSQLAGSAVPVTVAAGGRTTQALSARGGRDGRDAVASLRALSAGGIDQVPTPAYVPVDAGALVARGLDGEAQLQMERGGGVLNQLRVRNEGGTVFAGGIVGSDLGRALPWLARGQGVSPGSLHLVVPDSALAPVTGDQLTYSQPFTLNLGATSVTAAASDRQLTSHFTADPGDPALAATTLLADLAFIHFERPNVTYARGMIAMPPANWVPDPAFVTTLLRGLTRNPVLEPVTLDDYFATVPAVTDDTSGSRRLATGGSGPALPTFAAHAIAAERLRISGFSSATSGGGATAVTNAIDDTLLAAESSTLGSRARTAGVATAEHSLSEQLDQVQLATDRTITLTARNAPIPVTVLSNAPYTVRAVLTLSSDKFVFPRPGGSRFMVLDRATNPERIEATARTSGVLPVDVTLTSPRFGLVIARGQLTIRSTATSLVGIVLTLLALAVLFGWWARTWRRGRARRAAAAERGT